MVQVDDVDARDDAVRVREVGLEAGDPAVDRRLEVVARELDRVLPGADVDRPEAVRERLAARRAPPERRGAARSRARRRSRQPARASGPPTAVRRVGTRRELRARGCPRPSRAPPGRTGRPRPGTATATSATPARGAGRTRRARSGSPNSTASGALLVGDHEPPVRPPRSAARRPAPRRRTPSTPTPVSSTATVEGVGDQALRAQAALGHAAQHDAPRPACGRRRGRARRGGRTRGRRAGPRAARMAIASAPCMRSAIRRSRSRSSGGVGPGATATSVHASHSPGCSAATAGDTRPRRTSGSSLTAPRAAPRAARSSWEPNVVPRTSPPRAANVICGQTATA